MEPTKVDIYSGGKPVDVKVSLTVPIICQGGHTQCSIYVQMTSPRKDILITCPETLAFHSDTWNVVQTVRVKTKKDAKNIGVLKTSISVLIMPSESTASELVWWNHLQTVITVCTLLHLSVSTGVAVFCLRFALPKISL